MPPPPPSWGEVGPEGQTVRVVRFCLLDRVVTFPASELRKWEHGVGEPELLTIHAGKEQIVIEGVELSAIRTALDLGRLSEVRQNHQRSQACRGPQVRSITLEAV